MGALSAGVGAVTIVIGGENIEIDIRMGKKGRGVTGVRGMIARGLVHRNMKEDGEDHERALVDLLQDLRNLRRCHPMAKIEEKA
mmetsp:Transcript_21265/g.31673  ORF Transcript_21265/g.31673 Transcript_21265/m.31673 type:complete len:84 (+) Transcript_21265:78-329(+)